MALYKLEELVAYQLSMDLKKQVFDLLYSTAARHDMKFTAQVSDAAASVAANLAEGYYRFNPAEFATFVKYSRGSLQEVRTRLPDGVGKAILRTERHCRDAETGRAPGPSARRPLLQSPAAGRRKTWKRANVTHVPTTRFARYPSHVPTLADRFLEYVQIDTTADPAVTRSPSSEGQRVLLERLAAELSAMGIEPELREDLLLARIPASRGHEQAPCVGFVAHVDTSPELPGAAKPIVHRAYAGGDIRFPDDPELLLRPSEHPALAAKRGHDIVTASGLTLLGADDKAGVAIAMTLSARLMRGDVPHGPVSLAFTTDEEVGRGADGFDIERFGAVAAYTLDGGEVGELESENFNADASRVTFTGFNTHPGYAKGKMANALRALGHFLASLPAELSPEHTDEREGFLHPHRIDGGVERATVDVIVRNFDAGVMLEHRRLVDRLAHEAASKVRGITCAVEHSEQYRNMHDVLARHPHVVTFAEEAIRAAGITVIRKPIRGGTDGAKLSAMGLPAPNLFSGQHNIHSRLEWVSVQDMETSVDVCMHLCRIWAASQLPATRV